MPVPPDSATPSRAGIALRWVAAVLALLAIAVAVMQLESAAPVRTVADGKIPFNAST